MISRALPSPLCLSRYISNAPLFSIIKPEEVCAKERRKEKEIKGEARWLRKRKEIERNEVD